MRKYHYRSSTGDLTFLDSLEVFQFNDSAKLMLESFLAGMDIHDTAKIICKNYQISTLEAQKESSEFFDSLITLGLSPNQPKRAHSQLESWTPRNAIVHIIQNCNSPCVMCDCWKTKEDIKLSRESLKKFFQKFNAFGGSEIMISGGEPLLHPDLEGILSDIRESSLERLLNTNGILLHKNPWLYDAGIEQLVISMDGVDAESYKHYRGLNAFQHVLNNVETFKKKSPQTQIGARLTLNRSNFNKLPLLFKIAFTHGIDLIGFSPADTSSTSFARSDMNPEKTNHLNSLILPSTEEVKDFLSYFVPGNSDYEYINDVFKMGRSQWDSNSIISCLKYYESMKQNQQEVFDREPCFFPRLSVLVDYDGSVRSCFYSKNIGNINKIEAIDWSLGPRIAELRESGSCSNCRGRIFCDKGLS